MMWMLDAATGQSGFPGVPDVVGDLFPNLPNFIAHVLATIVIVVVLAKLLYKPFRNSIDNRRAKINELLDDAVAKQTEANKNQKESESMLTDAKNQSATILKNARADADAQRNQILDTANAEAANLQNQAKYSIAKSEADAQEQLRQQIVNVAFAAAEKVLGENVDDAKNQKIVDEFIKNLDKKESK